MRAKVLFVWHMHQPYYFDPVMKEMPLPWVRLHGVRGYNDLPYMISRFSLVRTTVNFVPSLMDQIDLLVSGGVVDSYHQLSLRNAQDLSVDEKVFLLRNFFSCPYDSMIKPYPRYASIWAQVNGQPSRTPESWQKTALTMATQDFLDLQVWFNLTWFGYAARKTFPEIDGWIRKGARFSEDDKKSILELQMRILAGLVPLYKKLHDEGRVEISTSPYFHPILPLLISSKTARRPRPELTLPDEFAWPQDARDQLRSAMDRQESLWGKPVSGVWPSEGSISPELVEMASSLEISWLASDEDVLRQSRPSDKWQDLSPYQTYVIESLPKSPRLIFRDRGLSDRIGFLYARYNGTEAALDLISGMERVEQVANRGDHPAVIPIILDGENPWESYPDGGYLFLSSLFERLEHHPRLQAMTVSEAVQEIPAKPLAGVASGSWINHDFNIWIGHHEDNKAWNYLGKTRQFLESELRSGSYPEEIVSSALREMYAAEGSDWFWWFGEDFETVQAADFDRLFRIHQQNVYRFLGKDVPLYLNEPVQIGGPDVSVNQPVDYIQPSIDGMVTHYYEWTGAGVFDAVRTQGAMFLGDPLIQKLYFGFDSETFYLRIDFDPGILAGSPDTPLLVIRLHNREELEWQLPLRSGALDVPATSKSPETKVLWACKKVGEMALPLKDIGLLPGEWFYLTVELSNGQSLMDQCPRGRALPVRVPDERFAQSVWRV